MAWRTYKRMDGGENMKAEFLNGLLQIYPENAREEAQLIGYVSGGVNEEVGRVFRTAKDGVPLEEKQLVFIQITKKGTPLYDTKKEIKGG